MGGYPSPLRSRKEVTYRGKQGSRPAVLERDYGLFRFKLLFLNALFVAQDAILDAIQDALSFAVVEFVLPPRNDNGCDAVADEIGNSAHLRHESIHPQQQRDACDGNLS